MNSQALDRSPVSFYNRDGMNALTLALAFALVACQEGLAVACPQCAANDSNRSGLAVGFLIGSMILLPFVVSTIVYRVIRKDLRE